MGRAPGVKLGLVDMGARLAAAAADPRGCGCKEFLLCGPGEGEGLVEGGRNDIAGEWWCGYPGVPFYEDLTG